MKRKDIEYLFIDIKDYEDYEDANNAVEELQGKITDFINNIECKVNEIESLLESIDINSLDNINDALKIAEQLSEDLN